MNRRKMNRYLNAVNAKLNSPSVKKLLMFGKIDSRYAKGIRDESGYHSTCNNIMQTAENVWSSTGGVDAVAERIANFSQVQGYSDVTKVQTIGAIDVTIWALANSIIPYVAIDRGLATPVDTIYYQNIVATNSVGKISTDDKVLGNFAPPNVNLDIGLMSGSKSVPGADAAASVTLDGYAVPGQIKVTLNVGGTEYVGQDFGADGTVYFPSLPTGTTVTVNYNDKKVEVNTLATGDSMTVDYMNDMTKDIEGSSVLKVTSQWDNVQLVTTPKEVILEANLLNNAWMNKTYKFSGGTSTKDYADLAFQRMTDVYVEAMNIDVLKTLVGRTIAEQTYHEANKVSMNFSTYDVSKFATTKNDLISQFIISMSAKFLARTNVAPTSIVTGTSGVALLSGHGDKWVANPAGSKGLNGLAGYFDGLPVVRHNYFDAITPTGKADFYMAAKFPDNSVASLAFGEFLPLTHTGNVSNFRNPINVANGFFSMTGSMVIEKALIQKGTVELPTVMSIAGV